MEAPVFGLRDRVGTVGCCAARTWIGRVWTGAPSHAAWTRAGSRGAAWPMETPEICPNCGADVPANARACPECGSDEQTGWSDQAKLERLGVPSQEFDYEEFVREEFATREGRVRPPGIRWLWWWVALVLLLVLGFLTLRYLH